MRTVIEIKDVGSITFAEDPQVIDGLIVCL
jgi:hypothetical protein